MKSIDNLYPNTEDEDNKPPSDPTAPVPPPPTPLTLNEILAPMTTKPAGRCLADCNEVDFFGSLWPASGNYDSDPVKYCLPGPSFCETVDASTGDCTACEKGFSLTVAKTCQPQEMNSINGCLFTAADNADVCLLCMYPFVLNGDGSMCEDTC